MSKIDFQAVHWQALVTLEEADRLLAYSDDVKINDVHLIQDVTDEWLTMALGAEVKGAKVEKSEVTGGHEGMTSRHKWKLTWNKEGQSAKLPTAIFFKTTPENALLREMLSVLHMAEREVNIFNILGEQLKDLIPICYYAKSYPGGRHIIILEDLEDRNITPHWMGDTLTVSHARSMAIAFAKLHARFWNSDRFETDLVFLRPRTRRWGERWQDVYFKENRKMFLESDVGKALSPYVKDLIRSWDENYMTIGTYWDNKPPTVVHGDSHLGNTLQYADGTGGMYDWQCCFRGYGYRDLSFFMLSGFTVTDCKAHERELFDLYTDMLESNGVKVDRDEAWKDYCLLAMECFDATMSSLTRGGYGHATHALLRQVETISYLVEKLDVSSLMYRVLNTSKI